MHRFVAVEAIKEKPVGAGNIFDRGHREEVYSAWQKSRQRTQRGSNGQATSGKMAPTPGQRPLDILRYFRHNRNMSATDNTEQVMRYADMFAAMGAEARLRIMQLLLTAHPKGLVVGDIQDELGIPPSTLSHHLDKLRNEELVNVRREGTFLWYTANAEALQELLNFLYAECCTRNKAVKPGDLVLTVQASKGSQERKDR
jgi:DNA-binding transcriptional ArsR family regulator